MVCLAGIKFDDRLLVTDRLDFIARGQSHQHTLEEILIEMHPFGDSTAGGEFEIFVGQLT